MKFALCLGGNEGPVEANFDLVEEALRAAGAAEIRRSRIFVTSPVDCVPGTPDFLNQALTGEWHGSVESLFDLLQALERRCGRPEIHSSRESRPLDCDLILWGEEVISTPRLQIPHPRARQRLFVLEPLAEIAPEMRFMPEGLTVAQCLQKLRA